MSERPPVSEIKKKIGIIMTFVNDQVKLGITNSLKIEKAFIIKHNDIYEKYPWIVKKLQDEKILDLYLL